MRKRIVKKIFLETEKVIGIVGKPVAKAAYATARVGEIGLAGIFEVGSDYIALEKYNRKRTDDLARGDIALALESKNIINGNNISTNMSTKVKKQVLSGDIHGINEPLQNDPHVSNQFASTATLAPFEGRTTGVNSVDRPTLENASTEPPNKTAPAQPSLAPTNTGSKIDAGSGNNEPLSTGSNGNIGFNQSGGSAAPTSSEPSITPKPINGGSPQLLDEVSNKTLLIAVAAIAAVIYFAK